MNLYLVGLPGVGKTTVGTALAKRLRRRLVDLDHAIEAETGKTIARIFAESGEATFRRIETQQLLRVAARDEVVVSTGGGVVCSDRNIRTMKAGGRIVFLDDTVDNILSRLDSTQVANRPILGSGSAEELAALSARRRGAYLQADLRVDLGSRGIDEVVEAIHAAFFA